MFVYVTLLFNKKLCMPKPFLYIFLFVKESCLNILEYGKQTAFFIFVLSLSLTGVCVVDSSISSVSKKAEDELKIDSANTILITFRDAPLAQQAEAVFRGKDQILSYEKNSRLAVRVFSNTYSGAKVISVIGTDKQSTLIERMGLSNIFNGNVAIIKGECEKISGYEIQVGGIPFKVIGCDPIKNTSFLDSLGLGGAKNEALYLPLDTVMRIESDSHVDRLTVRLKSDVSLDDMNYFLAILNNKFKASGDVSSYLTAKQTVDNVISRFSLLSSFIYLFLLISSSIIVVMMCRKIFDERQTEFALKIIHGVNINIITVQVCIEFLIKSLIAFILSAIFSVSILNLLSYYIKVDIYTRFNIVLIIYIIVFISGLLTSVLCGRGFYKINPVSLIRGRFC